MIPCGQRRVGVRRARALARTIARDSCITLTHVEPCPHESLQKLSQPGSTEIAAGLAHSCPRPAAAPPAALRPSRAERVAARPFPTECEVQADRCCAPSNCESRSACASRSGDWRFSSSPAGANEDMACFLPLSIAMERGLGGEDRRHQLLLRPVELSTFHFLLCTFIFQLSTLAPNSPHFAGERPPRIRYAGRNTCAACGGLPHAAPR